MTAPLRRSDESLVEALAARSPGDNVSLLLAVARRHVARRTPRTLRAQWSSDSFVQPSVLDLRMAHALDGLALDAAGEFEALLLSPLAPLGTCAAVSPSSQDRIVTTIRGSEVVSDPTNVLAFVAADRLTKGAAEVRLCTLGQVVRAQRFAGKKGFSQHFRMFATVEAGVARPEHAFEVQAFVRHVALYQSLFDAAKALGCEFPDRSATLFSAPRQRGIAERVRAELTARLPNLPVEEEAFESPYYDGVRLMVSARGTHGEPVPIGDIGLFDWAAKLGSNKKLRLVASGLGIQLFPLLFREDHSALALGDREHLVRST